MDGTEDVQGLGRFDLPRRGVLMTGLIGGFSLAAGQVSAQVIHTDTNGLDAGEIKIESDGADLPAYYARPQGPGPFPMILVLEEVFGVHEHIKDICRRLAKLGALAVSVEYYARLGDLSKMTDAAIIMRDVISKAPDGQIMRDLDAAAAWAAKNKGDMARFGVIGFCQGGRNTWLYAERNPALKAAVAFYGTVNVETNALKPVSPVLNAGALKCPLLSLSGDADTSAKPALLKRAATIAHDAGKTVELHFYPGAGHAFFADYRPSYNQDAAVDAWRRAVAWFRKYGVLPNA